MSKPYLCHYATFLRCKGLLDMHENTISGHLPDDFGLNHTGLKLLDLHKNDISGIIPENLG